MAVAENALLAMIPKMERMRLHLVSEVVQLESGSVLCEAGNSTRYAYFPKGGSISLLTAIDDQAGPGVALVGHEGMQGAELVLGGSVAPLLAVVQTQGLATRVEAAQLRQELVHCKVLQLALARYASVLLEQVSTSTVCASLHGTGQRLARWLLMSQDHTGGGTIHLTQERLSRVLCVRRESVTEAAMKLQKQGLIRYWRGVISVVDRPGLEAAACGCYAADLRALRRLREFKRDAEQV